MAKVYIVISGLPASRKISGVTTNKEVAEAYCKTCGLYPSIEEMEMIDDKIIDKTKHYAETWEFSFRSDGTVEDSKIIKYTEEPSDDHYIQPNDAKTTLFKVQVCGKDKEEALKKAKAVRTEYYVELYGLKE